MKLSRATVAVIRQNIIVFAFGLNAVAMASAALGMLGPIAAAILHQAGSFLVLLNAMRLLAFGDWASLGPVRGVAEPGPGDRAARRPARPRPGRRRPAPVAGGSCSRSAWLAALIAYATWGWTAIGPGEVGLLRRHGRFAACSSRGCTSAGRRRSRR